MALRGSSSTNSNRVELLETPQAEGENVRDSTYPTNEAFQLNHLQREIAARSIATRNSFRGSSRRSVVYIIAGRKKDSTGRKAPVRHHDDYLESKWFWFCCFTHPADHEYVFNALSIAENEGLVTFGTQYSQMTGSVT
jgi:hypothetical protein